ncbi:MAG: type II toxin-antitoxin system VapC family toxin, partial [Microcystaceae cyanobacterium]
PEQWIDNSLQQLNTKEAPLCNQIAILSRQINLSHQDPADRFIAATAVYYGLILATVDRHLTETNLLETIS